MTDTIQHISVIELDFHHDSLDGFLKIFENSSVRISAFTTAKNIRLLRNVHYPDNITFYSFSGGSKYLFLKKHKEVLSASQIVFVNTIANDFGAFMTLDKELNSVLRVHNVNKQFSPLKNIFWPRSLFFTWKFFSYLGRQVAGKGFWFFRPLINQRFRYFTFPDQGITDYVREMKYTDAKKILPPIPLKIFREEDTAFQEYSNVLNITIIGATDQRRRQYEQVIDALKLVYDGAQPPSVQLTLLGNCHNAYGKTVIDQLSTITNPQFSLKTYTAQVPEQEFIACIKRTHLIISPITSHASTDIFKEVYGKTKTTGSILDFLKFGKTTLVPSHYTPPKELSEYILKYNNAAQLAEIISELSVSKRINTLNTLSLEYVKKNYSREVVLKNALSIFTSVLKNK